MPGQPICIQQPRDPQDEIDASLRRTWGLWVGTTARHPIWDRSLVSYAIAFCPLILEAVQLTLTCDLLGLAGHSHLETETIYHLLLVLQLQIKFEQLSTFIVTRLHVQDSKCLGQSWGQCQILWTKQHLTPSSVFCSNPICGQRPLISEKKSLARCSWSFLCCELSSTPWLVIIGLFWPSCSYLNYKIRWNFYCVAGIAWHCRECEQSPRRIPRLRQGN